LSCSPRALTVQLFRRAASVIWAKKTYGRLNLTLWANQTLTALAANECIAIRMAVAGHELFLLEAD
jgi:hypothetical protein